ncbi:MAG: DUF1304 domain-containing protein [Planctomycetota bacterium]|nr:DUF1304 domain-containing protein [Planctomycetota bacterium]
MFEASSIMVALVAALHLAFLVLEMFLWDKALGRTIFRHSKQQAAATKVLAANQGLYNGFLAAGLIWGLYLSASDPESGRGASIQLFFLTCILIAGLYGAKTASRTILWVQALPAAVALVLVAWS